MGKIPGHTTDAEFSEAPLIVYFSSVSENTARFVQKLGLPAERIPLYPHEAPLQIEQPFILVTPTYGGGVPATA